MFPSIFQAVGRALVVILALSGTPRLPAAVEIYPGVEDLTGFKNLRKSDRYAVRVNGQPLFVYASRNRTGNDTNGKPIKKGYIAEAHFCYFSFANETVTIEVTGPAGTSFSQATVHPTRLNLPVETDQKTLRFRLDTPRKLVVKTTPEELYPLIILADAPDTDIPSGPNVTRYGPGLHDIGFQRPIRDGETIYLDGGAIVKGTLFKAKKGGPLKNFTLRGRGILYSGDYEFIARQAGWGRGITGWEAGLDRGRIEGCIFLDSVHWNTGFGNRNTVFENLKIISWHGNTDGIRVGPDSVCRDSFVMNNDDALLPEGSFPAGTSALFENCVVWHHAWGSVFKIINLTDRKATGVHHLTYRNIDVLESGVGESPVFLSPNKLSKPDKLQSPTYQILFENIYIERASTLFALRPPGGNTLSDVTFRNIHAPVANGVIQGWDEQCYVKNLTIENLVVGGRPVRSIDETQIKVGPFVQGFKITSP